MLNFDEIRPGTMPNRSSESKCAPTRHSDQKSVVTEVHFWAFIFEWAPPASLLPKGAALAGAAPNDLRWKLLLWPFVDGTGRSR